MTENTGCEYGKQNIKRLEEKITNLSEGCSWGRVKTDSIDNKVEKLENYVNLLESRIWKLVVGVQLFNVVLNIILVIFK